MLTERGKIILEFVKSINNSDNLPYHLVVEKAVNEYNELVKRNIIEPPYEHSNNIEEYKYNYSSVIKSNTPPSYAEEKPEGWEESLRMFDNIMCNP